MRMGQISPIGFGLKPYLKVKDNQLFFKEVAEKFDQQNKTLVRKPGDSQYYEILYNSRGIIFTDRLGDLERKIKFGPKLAKELLEKSADYVAQTLAFAAEIFALGDELWSKSSEFAEGITKDKRLSMNDSIRCKYEDVVTGPLYNDYIIPALECKLKENGFISRAKIEL